MLKKKIYIIKNSSFNTLNLNKKKILKKKYSQFKFRKKNGNFYSGVFIIIYNKLFERNLSKFYINRKKNTVLKKNKILSRLIFIYNFIYKKSFFFTKILFYFFSKKPKLEKKKIIFQSSFEYSNQMSFVPLAKKLKKKEYYILIDTIDNNKVQFFKELYGYKNVINIYNFFEFKDLIKSIIFFAVNFNKILSFKNIFYLNKIDLIKIFITCFKSYFLYSNNLKILKILEPKKFLLMSSIGNEMLIAAIKDITKANIISYAVQGVSFTAQSLTSQFLFNSVDKLFCYGVADYNHFKKISLNKEFIFPKQISISGSVRDFYFKNKKKIQNNKNKLKILYLKSNSIWFGNLDGYYVNLFTKALETKFKNKFYYQIKERKNFISDDVKYLIKNEYINKKNVLIEKKMLTEKIIFESDIIVGTISTSLIYQSLYYNKIIIQLGSNNFPWAKNLGYLGILCAKNENEIIRLLRNILFSPKYLQTIKKNQKYILKNLVSKRNAIKTILDHIDK